MYLKVTLISSYNLILISEKNYKKQAQIFHQKHSLGLAFHTVDVLCNLILKNHWTWT